MAAPVQNYETQIKDYEVLAVRMGGRYRWEILQRKTHTALKYSDAIYPNPEAALNAGEQALVEYVQDLRRRT